MINLLAEAAPWSETIPMLILTIAFFVFIYFMAKS